MRFTHWPVIRLSLIHISGAVAKSITHLKGYSLTGSFSFDHTSGKDMSGSMFIHPGFYPVDAGSAEGLRWQPLSGIEKPGSGTEPIHQEHVMCSRFRGSCPSDVKSAGHPEPGFSIPLTGCSAALCTPNGAQKHPGGRKHRSIPPQSQTLSSVHPKPGVEPLPSPPRAAKKA